MCQRLCTGLHLHAMRDMHAQCFVAAGGTAQANMLEGEEAFLDDVIGKNAHSLAASFQHGRILVHVTITSTADKNPHSGRTTQHDTLLHTIIIWPSHLLGVERN